MTDLSVSRSSYQNRRSPGAFIAAAAFNGGIVALLIAIPVSYIPTAGDQPTIIRFIPHDPPPPPVRQTPEPDPKAQVRNVAPEPTRIEPTVVDPFVELGRNPPVIGTLPPPPFPGGGDIVETVRPPEPVIVKARPDPRFAGAFHPDYPPAMRRDGLEGDVTVRVAIDTRGRVTSVDLVMASDPRFYEETRRQALKSWRFVPATRDGAAIESVQTMTVRFRLER